MDTTQLDKLTAENAELMAKVKRQEAELQTEQSKAKEAERRAADAERGAAAAPPRVAALEEKIRETEKAKSEAESKVAALEAKLRDAQPIPPPPTPPDLQRVRRMLANGGRPFYTTQDERELMPGRTGTWHIIHLLQGGKDWEFADREFALTDPAEIKASAAHFRDDVLRPLTQAHKHWQLYARGAADARRVTGPTGREFYYLPSTPGGVHTTQPVGKRVTIPVQNKDLPILRADWLREIVRPILGSVEPSEIEILDNPPQQGHGLTAELVLFVEW